MYALLSIPFWICVWALKCWPFVLRPPINLGKQLNVLQCATKVCVQASVNKFKQMCNKSQINI